MQHALDWSTYEDAGLGDAYADIPKHGGNYAKAVAACINSGQCETDGKLVMCPSFKVSGDQHLSTGGRVRLLKEALSTDHWQTALSDPELARAMDLCVSCKGCKRECDNNVDMALIKVEYLAWRAKHKTLSLRSRLFADTPRWLYHLPWLRHLIAWRNKSACLRILMEKFLGLSAALPLPVPAAAPFQDPAVNHPTSSANTKTAAEPAPQQTGQREALPEIVLLVDTFTRYFEPDIAEAAEQVLRAAAYSVQVATPESTDGIQRPLCCGRTYLAQGLVDKARAEVSRLVDVLTPHLTAGRIIVGLEASCVLGLRDDALALGLGEPLQAISKQVFLFEEFLAKEIMAKRLQLPLQSPVAKKTLIHGHCHQKAVGAMKAVRRVMKLLPDHEFSMIESGCCGMAGTFSLEAEHQGIGSEMAQRDLIPALNNEPDARVVANGFSCRQQMRAHGDQRPQHLAILLRDALAK